MCEKSGNGYSYIFVVATMSYFFTEYEKKSCDHPELGVL